MQKIENFENVSVNESPDRPTAGGYVCKILSAEDNGAKEYLKLEFDIAEGNCKDYASSLLERFGFCPLSFYRSYKAKAVGMFKQFLTAVEKSNPRYKWDWDEQSLVGLKVGLVLGEEEYRKKTGDTGTRFIVDRVLPIADISAGKFTVPEKKTLAPAAAPAFKAFEDDSDLPF